MDRVSLAKPGVLVTLLTIALLLLTPAAVAQVDRSLATFPSPISMAPGESVEVAAWFCRRLDSGDFGADGVPGTEDDRCEVVRDVDWSVEHERIVRLEPGRGGRATLEGRKDGVTTLTATYLASATSTFISRVPVDVAEPLPEEVPADDTGVEPQDGDPAEDGADAGAGDVGPAVQVSAVVQPPFAVLAPGDNQVFVAFLCLVLESPDPRGPDGIPGTADDLCRPNDAAWQLVGEPPVGTLDPPEGVFTVLTTDDEDEETGFVASGLSGPRTAVTEEQPTPRTGGVMADVAGHPASASVAVDPNAPEREGSLGDVDLDGDVDKDDLDRVLDALFSEEGDPRYDPLADFDGNEAVDWGDFWAVIANL